MKKQILSIIMAGCLLLSMTACSSDKKNTKSASEQTTADTSTSTTSPQEYSKTDFVMSTVLSEKIYGTKDVTQDIKEELDKLEKEQLSWREDSSVVSKINADAQKGTKTKLDSDMTSWVEDSLELARRSNGAFDPTIGRLTRLWNIEGDNPKVPSKQEVKNTLKDTGYTKIHLEKVETQNTAITKKNVDKDIKDNTDKNGDAAKDTDNNTINSTAQNTADNMVNNEANNTPDNTALNEERLETTDKKTNTDESISSIYIEDQCTLDLGAVGKGIACDVAQNYLKQQKEVSGAVIAVGGSILLYGSKTDGTNWNVAVQNQATDRAHRIGQKSVVNVYKLITKGTIEEKIVNLQERKQQLADKVLGGEGIGNASFNKEELLELLG